jgi:predicted acyl esterase
MTHHGGILCTFWANWYDMQVKTVQHGLGESGPRSRATGDLVCGPETLSEDELATKRCDLGAEVLAHPLDDPYHQARSADWSKVEVPFLSAANWGGQGLHPRGNFEGFIRAASRYKWLEVHGLEHWTEFYTDYGVALQKRFFDRYLKGAENGWERRPRVQLQIRHIDRYVERDEDEWPLARTRWTRFYLDPDPPGPSLGGAPLAEARRVAFDAAGNGITFWSPPLAVETEITGPAAARLFVSSSTSDADLFLVLRVFAPDGEEVVFQGALDPRTPVAQGWLRASHRKLDAALSTPYRPYHSHDAKQPLAPGEPVMLDIEIWPTSIMVPRGYRLALTVRGRDYEHEGPGARLSNMKNEFRGCGPFLHDDPRDRPPKIFGGRTTLHMGPESPAYLLLPIIPDGGPR